MLVFVGHAVPPFDAGVVIGSVLVCVPPPHVTEHADQAVQVPVTQLTARCKNY
jgi:hypothetical protein